MIASAPLLAQDRVRPLERIAIALQQPSPIELSAPVESPPRKLGVFTLVQPTTRGEIIRLSIPIGEMLTRTFKGAATANRRRQEASARRKVEAALAWFEEQLPSPKK